jgi:hypothetical protein
MIAAASDSDLLARHTAAYEVNAVLVIALGFSLRRFESGRGNATALPGELVAKLRSAEDPAGEAGLVAQQLAGPRRHSRLMAIHMLAQAAEAAGTTSPGLSTDSADSRDTAAINGGASARFKSIFGPGDEVWEPLAAWARETGQDVARRRMESLLDPAGVRGAVDFESLIDRLDVDFLYRFGYALAACEEQLSPVIS